MKREKGADNREKVSGNLEVYGCEVGSRGRRRQGPESVEKENLN